ncbi:MAG: pirin, partial [Thermoanaerobaculia bacterium]
RPCLIPWEALQIQFGADYGRLRDFKRKFLGHLADVLHVYPAVRLSAQPAGLLLRPSPTHLPRHSAKRS